MKCPRCVQMIHRSASQCPHCGFALEHLDEKYDIGEREIQRLSDAAGVLRMADRKKLEVVFDRFDANFPQLFCSVYFGALEEVSSIRQFGMWLLNRAEYTDLAQGKTNEGGVLVVVDVSSKSAVIVYGYLLDLYLKENDTYLILSKAHPHFLKGDYTKAMKTIVTHLRIVLRKRSRQARQNPEKYRRLAAGIHGHSAVWNLKKQEVGK